MINYINWYDIMTLIKDFLGNRIVYYWTLDGQTTATSPHFASIEHASEWYIKYNNSLYDGEERRASHIDRRTLHHKRDEKIKKHVSSDNPDGRRETDKPVKVGIDLSKQKLLEMAELYNTRD